VVQVGQQSTPRPYGTPFLRKMFTQPSYSHVDGVALQKIKLSALLGVIGIILGSVLPLTTLTGFGIGLFGNGAVASTFFIYGTLFITGFIFDLVSVLQVRSAFKALATVDHGFHTPAKMVLAFLLGLSLVTIGFIVLVSFVAGAFASNISVIGI
jgi:hypothetical protein